MATQSDKLRGGYYTDPDIAAWLCSWAIRRKDDRVLEPSCGDGVFLAAAAKRKMALGAQNGEVHKSILGVEMVAAEADKAVATLRQETGASAEAWVERADFFEWCGRANGAQFDCVVGNPPFIRYQSFPEPSRSLAMALMEALGLKANRLTNVWVPFVAGAVDRLAPGGRLAMVLPAEILQVSYAAQLRHHLRRTFRRLHIVTCNQLLFEQAEQEVVLLLAEGRIVPPSDEAGCSLDLREYEQREDLLAAHPVDSTRGRTARRASQQTEKWLEYFLTPREREFMRELRQSAATTSLSTYASVDVGVVTGNNDFFILDMDGVTQHGLRGQTVGVVSRSAQLEGAVLRRGDWQGLSRAGARVHLFTAESPVPPQSPVAAYISSGERMGVHRGYKCSVRQPWHAVPSAWVPDAFLFRQIHGFPRIVVNAAQVTSTDTIHRLRSKQGVHELAACLHTYLTAASAEIEGRSYGGGVLELEPTEAERLLVPSPMPQALCIEEIDGFVRTGRLSDVLDTNSQMVLREGMGLSERECRTLRDIWQKLMLRRSSRRRNGRSTHAPEDRSRSTGTRTPGVLAPRTARS